MRRAVLTLAAFCFLLSARADAGGTSVSMSLVTVPPLCQTLSGFCTNDQPDECTASADCSVGSVDPRSKFSFSAKKGVLKASLRGVQDGLGTSVTTDGTLGTDDDYILLVHFTDCDYANALGCDDAAKLEQGFALKVELRGGKAKLNVDLKTTLEGFPAGRALRMRGAELRLPPTSPASCPGDNSAAGLASRSYESCQTGPLLGFAGILNGE
jgi:hypothetical protein